MEIIEVSDRTPELMEQLLIIWENSVKETHLFLSEAEIADISKYVPQALAGVPHLIVARMMQMSRLHLWGLITGDWKCCL